MVRSRSMVCNDCKDFELQMKCWHVTNCFFLDPRAQNIILEIDSYSAAAFISRLADNDREQALLKTKLGNIERKVDGLASRGYVDNLVKSLEG